MYEKQLNQQYLGRYIFLTLSHSRQFEAVAGIIQSYLSRLHDITAFLFAFGKLFAYICNCTQAPHTSLLGASSIQAFWTPHSDPVRSRAACELNFFNMFSDFFLNRKSFLYFAVLAIAMQAFHFAQMDRQMLNGAFILNILTGMVCEFTVFGLAIHARQNKRIWLIAFTLLSASVNLVVTGVIPGVIGKIIWSVFLPIAIEKIPDTRYCVPGISILSLSAKKFSFGPGLSRLGLFIFPKTE